MSAADLFYHQQINKLLAKFGYSRPSDNMAWKSVVEAEVKGYDAYAKAILINKPTLLFTENEAPFSLDEKQTYERVVSTHLVPFVKSLVVLLLPNKHSVGLTFQTLEQLDVEEFHTGRFVECIAIQFLSGDNFYIKYSRLVEKIQETIDAPMSS